MRQDKSPQQIIGELGKLLNKQQFYELIEKTETYQGQEDKFLNAKLIEFKAAAHASLNHYEQAIELYKQCLNEPELKTYHSRIFENLIKLLEHYINQLIQEEQPVEMLNDSIVYLLKLQPTNRIGKAAYATSLRKSGELEKAKQVYKEAIASDYDTAVYWNGLGVIALEEGDQILAKRYFLTATALYPELDLADTNLVVALYDLGLNEEALRLGKHITLTEDDASNRYMCGQIQLRQGLFIDGWTNYESRWKTAFYKAKTIIKLRNHLKTPTAHPDRLEGKTILIYTEQGLGDAIMMLRLLPMLATKCNHIILFNLREELNRYIRDFPEILNCISLISAQDFNLPDHDNVDAAKAIANLMPYHDCHCGIMSLPYLLNIEQTEIPSPLHFSPPFEVRKKWLDYVENLKKAHKAKRVFGLTASGNHLLQSTQKRDFPMELLEDCFAPDDLVLVLQKQLRANEERFVAHHPNFIFIGDDLSNFEDTALIVEALDAVISVDSSVAHLSGNLNTPCFILLPEPAEWRWMIEREDCPWYPNAKLVRQLKNEDNWGGVANRLKLILKDLSEKMPMALTPTLLDEAQTMMDKNDFNGALGKVDAYLKLYPEHIHALNIKAIIFARFSLFDLALPLFETLVRKMPQRQDIKQQMMRCKDRLKK